MMIAIVFIAFFALVLAWMVAPSQAPEPAVAAQRPAPAPAMSAGEAAA